tara:strand:+ start:249 stop:1571 length:1323 start_codon:yes stop_codon:yes gene_type:complete
MRTLNRPMFRYGGPIKEGVMDGIREPRKNGGSMSQLVQPSGTGMRPGYKGKSKLLSFIPGFNYVSQQTKGIIPRIFNKIKPTFKNQPGIVTGGTKGGTVRSDALALANYKRNIMPPVPFSQRIMPFVKENPYFTGAVAPFALSTTAAVAPPVAKGIGSIAKATGMQLADLAVPDFIFDQDEYFANKEKEKLEKDVKKSKQTANEKRIKELEALLAADTSVNQGKTQDQIREERIQKYRDIMDIKGMNKTAAYDSLIAASQAVNQAGGDLKGAIKDGSLINQIIQSTSKAFDKPKQTKDAIDTLILKGEIEADIAAGKPSTYLKAAQDMVATGASKNITEAMKTLTKSENSMSTTLGAILAKGNRLDEKTVGVAYREETGNIPAGSVKISEVNEWKEDNKGKNEVDYVKEIMKISELTPGDYIIGERVVTVDEDKSVSFFY